MECTQQFYAGRCDSTPEQIGFLGICGMEYPVMKGPNKIGRDPSTCSIVLNRNSISRQHAVINVINEKDFVLMDLGSANRTKLMGQFLPAYMPKPLRDGDTVQFGDAFGIFRLLEENDDLPMTQAIDVPETPVVDKPAARLNVAATVVPESPDVSDRDDSFIMPTQPKSDQKFKTPINKFIKQSSKTIAIQPVGSNKIDNIFWNSSKKSTSLNLDDSKSSLNDSAISVRSENGPSNQSIDIHELETQPPPGKNDIYEAATQMPPCVAGTIHEQETQYPLPNENLPQVRKIDNQHDMHIDFCMANKENEDIFNAETQLFVKNAPKIEPALYDAETQMPTVDQQSKEKDVSILEANTQLPNKITCKIELEAKNNASKNSSTATNISKEKNDSEDDVILFEEVDSQSFQEEFSQRILTDDFPIHDDDNDKEVEVKNEENYNDNKKEGDDISKLGVNESSTAAKRLNRLKSDSSTDCEDIEIEQSQKEPFKPSVQDEVVTDCEDDLFDNKPLSVKKGNSVVQDSPEIDFGDMPTQILEEDLINTTTKNATCNKSNNDVNFEDMPTQVLQEDNPEEKIDFEDLPTQILLEDTPVKPSLVEKIKTNQFSEEIVSPFKVPLQTPLKSKRKDSSKVNNLIQIERNENIEEKYYEATQDILNDLSTQQECSPELLLTPRKSKNVANKINSSHTKCGTNSSVKQQFVQDKSESSVNEENVNVYVENLSSSQVREVIGVKENVSAPKKMPSDSLDGEATPKKFRPFKLMTTDLPDSQEIKTSVSNLNSKSLTTDSSSESEAEESSQDGTPILFRKKTKPKNNVKVDLREKFDTSALPARVITRVRKPTPKLLDSDHSCKKLGLSILKPAALTGQPLEIDKEIIQENLTRLKTTRHKRSLDKSVSAKTDDTKQVSFSDTSTVINKEDTKIHEQTKKENKKDESLKNKEYKFKEKKDEKLKDGKEQSAAKSKTKHKSEESKSKNTSKERRKNDKNANLLKDRQDESEDKTRPRRSRNKTDTKTGKDKNDSVKDASSLSKTIESILTTSNNNSKNSSTTSESNTGKKRSFRYRGKSDNKIEEEKTPEKEVPKKKRGRSKLLEKKVERDESSPELVVRRSRRCRVAKEAGDKDVGRQGPAAHERSAVYSLSAESGADSPGRKRAAPAADEARPPSPKRTRSVARSDASVANAACVVSARASPLPAQTHHVLFTAFPSQEVKTKLEELGAVVVTEVRSCSVVVTVQVRRTFKLLCAVGLGRPVVGPAWVQACVDTARLLDPWEYLLEDVANERRYSFSLAATLRGPRGYLARATVSATPSVVPPPHEMQQIVECSGGTWCGDAGRLPRTAGPRVVVSCAADRALWPALQRRGVALVHAEFILTGVLRQEFDVDTYKLC